MDMQEFGQKEDIRNFFEGIVSQSRREFAEEVFDAAVDAMYEIYVQAKEMDKSDADMYLTTCLGLYLIESFQNGTKMVTIKPRS